MFELITVSDGTKYHYAIHKGEKRPVISKMNEEFTDEPNGTEVKIIIKDGDKYNVKQAIKNTLTYFDNITYINCGLDNNYQLIKGNHFIYHTDRSMYNDYENAHLCLGKVRYPIDWKTIGYDKQLTIPVGLYFDIGEIPVVWNRENVEYTDKAIEKIREKVTLVKEELEELYKKHHSNINTLEEFLSIESSKEIIVYRKDDITYKVYDRRGTIASKPVYGKYKHLKVTNNSSLFSNFKKDKHITSGGRILGSGGYISGKTFEDNTVYVPFGYVTSSIKDQYIGEKYGGVDFIRSGNKKNGIRSILTAFFDSQIKYNIWDEYGKDVRQKVIKEAHQLYDELIDYAETNSIIYDSVIVPQDYIDKAKELEQQLEKEKDEEFYFRHASVYDSFTSERVRGGDLKRRFKNSTVIYGFREDRNPLREVKKIIFNELRHSALDYIYVIQISQANERIVRNQLENRAYHVGSQLDDIKFLHRIENKYNKLAWVVSLKNEGLSVATSNYNSYTIPSYIDPSEPSKEKKEQFYAQVGDELKYPMLKYTHRTPPAEVTKEYKQQCPNHYVNPILIGKKHVKEYEDKRNKKQQSSDTDSGN